MSTGNRGAVHHRLAVALAASITSLWLCGPQASGAPASGPAPVAAPRTDASPSELESAAARGDSAAQFRLAQSYEGTSHGDAEARAWFARSASQGNPGAEYGLALLLRDGRGGPRDDQAAFAWLSKAARAGYSAAEVGLGDAFLAGRGVPRDIAQAQEWYRAAAVQGDVDGQVALGELCLAPPPRPSPASGRMTCSAAPARDYGRRVRRWKLAGDGRLPQPPRGKNQLRAEGALTVPVGTLSRHSVGSPSAPGAYDVVVTGRSPAAAAEALRKSGFSFRRIFPEEASGDQGPHLHLETLLGHSTAPPRLDDLLEGPAKALPSVPITSDQAMFWLAAARHSGSSRAGGLMIEVRRSGCASAH